MQRLAAAFAIEHPANYSRDDGREFGASLLGRDSESNHSHSRVSPIRKAEIVGGPTISTFLWPNFRSVPFADGWPASRAGNCKKKKSGPATGVTTLLSPVG